MRHLYAKYLYAKYLYAKWDIYTPNIYTPNIYTPNIYTLNVYAPNQTFIRQTGILYAKVGILIRQFPVWLACEQRSELAKHYIANMLAGALILYEKCLYKTNPRNLQQDHLDYRRMSTHPAVMLYYCRRMSTHPAVIPKTFFFEKTRSNGSK
jgi:hypothetical protein